MEFIQLETAHWDALQDMLADFAAAGEPNIPSFFGKPEWGADETVAKFAAWGKGEEIGGFVPNTTTFLIDEGCLLGVYNLRHDLTERLVRYGGHVGYSVRPSARRQGHATRILAHAKEVARNLGIPRLLVTCDPTNTGSARSIEKNGGVLEDEFFHEVEERMVRRYWIDLEIP